MKKNKTINAEEPKKQNKHAVREDKETADETEGEPIKPKTQKRKPSKLVALRHKRVLDRVLKVGQGRKTKLYDAMIAEGYSEEYARSGGIKFKKSWDQLMTERLGDDKLSNIHQQLMTAKKLDYMLFAHDIPDEAIYELLESVGCIPKKIIHGAMGTHAYYFAPDNKTRKDALELAHKIRGKMSPETIKIEQTGLRNMSDADLAEVIRKQVSRFTKKD